MEQRTRLGLIPRETFQIRFMLVNVGHFLLIIVALLAAIFIPVMTQLDNLSLTVAQRGQIADQFLSFHERLWLPILLIFVLLVLHSIFFSYKIAGPLLRFREMFKAIGEGNLEQTAHIRRNDYLRKEAESLNDMAAALRERVHDLKTQCRDLNLDLAGLNNAADGRSEAERKEALKSLAERVERLNTSLDRFSTGKR